MPFDWSSLDNKYKINTANPSSGGSSFDWSSIDQNYGINTGQTLPQDQPAQPSLWDKIKSIASSFAQRGNVSNRKTASLADVGKDVKLFGQGVEAGARNLGTSALGMFANFGEYVAKKEGGPVDPTIGNIINSWKQKNEAYQNQVESQAPAGEKFLFTAGKFVPDLASFALPGAVEGKIATSITELSEGERLAKLLQLAQHADSPELIDLISRAQSVIPKTTKFLARAGGLAAAGGAYKAQEAAMSGDSSQLKDIPKEAATWMAFAPLEVIGKKIAESPIIRDLLKKPEVSVHEIEKAVIDSGVSDKELTKFTTSRDSLIETVKPEFKSYVADSAADSLTRKELLDNAEKSPVLSGSVKESIAHYGEDISKLEEKGVFQYPERANTYAGEFVYDKMSTKARGSLKAEVEAMVANTDLSAKDKFAQAVRSIIENPGSQTMAPNLTKYVNSVLGIVDENVRSLEANVEESKQAVSSYLSALKDVHGEAIRNAGKVSDEVFNSEAGARVFQEMQSAQPGFRMRGAEVPGVGNTTETISGKSSFPQWVPKDLRKTEVFQPVLKHLSEGTVPTVKKQKALYDIATERMGSFFKQSAPEVAATASTTFKAEIIPGLSEFIEQDVSPAIGHIADSSKQIRDEIISAVSPAQANEMAGQEAGIIREQNARLQARKEIAIKSGEKNQKEFAKKTTEENLKFMEEVDKSTGTSPLHQQFKQRADAAKAMIESTGRDTKGWSDSYFPRMFKDDVKATKLFSGIGKSLEGSKGFLKKRSYETIYDAVAAAKEHGLALVSSNPEELMRQYEFGVWQYKTAHDIFNEMKDKKMASFVRFGDKSEGMIKLDDKIATVLFKGDQGIVKAGDYYAQPEVAKIFNNFLSPGLGGSKIYRTARALGNTINQFQLGLSGFHATFVTFDASISDFAMGLRYGKEAGSKLLKGDIGGAVKFGAEAIKREGRALIPGASAARAFKQGMGMEKDLMAEKATQLTDSFFAGGARMKMDAEYKNNALQDLTNTFKEKVENKNIIGAAYSGITKAPKAIIETVAKPLMEKYVPIMKQGIFADMAKFELEKNPEMTQEELRKVMGKAWDSVDNRLGQLTYDNLFWNKTNKDMGMVMTRSLGWNLGSIREIGGGAMDIPKEVANVFSGKGFDFNNRMSYLLALPAVTAVYGGVYMYLRTGQKPEKMIDYFYPKNGRKLPNGKDERISMPGYMKDVISYLKDPVQTVKNKANPEIAMVEQMLNNKDFYGTQIVNPNDSGLKKAQDYLTYAFTSVEPFSLRASQPGQTPAPTTRKVEQFFGLTKAPYYVSQTKGEQAVAEIMNNKFSGTKTKDQTTKNNLKSAARDALQQGALSGDVVQNLVKQGVITAKGAKAFVKSSKETSMQRSFGYLTSSEQRDVWGKLSAAEKAEVKKQIHLENRNQLKIP